MRRPRQTAYCACFASNDEASLATMEINSALLGEVHGPILRLTALRAWQQNHLGLWIVEDDVEILNEIKTDDGIVTAHAP